MAFQSWLQNRTNNQKENTAEDKITINSPFKAKMIPFALLRETTFSLDLVSEAFNCDTDGGNETPTLKCSLLKYIVKHKFLLERALANVPPLVLKDLFQTAFLTGDDVAIDLLVFHWPMSRFNLMELIGSVPMYKGVHAHLFLRQRLKTIWESMTRSCCYNSQRTCTRFDLTSLGYNFTSLGFRFFIDTIIKNLLVILGAFHVISMSEPSNQHLPVCVVTEWIIDFNKTDLVSLILRRMLSYSVFTKSKLFQLEITHLQLILQRLYLRRMRISLSTALETADSFLSAVQVKESMSLQFSGFNYDEYTGEEILSFVPLRNLFAKLFKQLKKIYLSIQVNTVMSGGFVCGRTHSASAAIQSLFSEISSTMMPALETLHVNGNFCPLLLKKVLLSSMNSLKELNLQLNHSQILYSAEKQIESESDNDRDKLRMLGLLATDPFVDIRHHLTTLSIGNVNKTFLPYLIALINCTFPNLLRFSLKDTLFPAVDFKRVSKCLCFSCPKLKIFTFERAFNFENTVSDVFYFADVLQSHNPSCLALFGISCGSGISKGKLIEQKIRSFTTFVM